MSTAVVIIDVQRALAEGKYKTFGVEAVIQRLNAVTERARNAGLPVIFVQHESKGPVMAKGSSGWEFAHGLRVEPADRIVPKNTEDSFHLTDLPAVLASLNVDRLVVGGIQTDFCVDTTVRRALALGYDVTLISDGHTTLANEVLSAPQIIAHHNATLSSISGFGPCVELQATEQFLAKTCE